MNSVLSHAVAVAALAATLGVATSVAAQDAQPQTQQQTPFGFFDKLMGQPKPKVAQADDDADLVLKVDHLQAEIRRLTGQIEQLQYRNQQLETQLARQSGAAPPVTAAPNSMTSAAPRAAIQSGPVSAPPVSAGSPVPASPPPVITAERSGRGDAFDPNQHPNAPGAPRALGGSGINPVLGDGPRPEPPVGVPGGRGPGTPLDLSTMATNAPGNAPAASAPAGEPGMNAPLPPPPSRNLSATGAVVATLPPTASPKDQYDLGYGYVLRKDYALAEDALGTFLKKYPNDKLAPDAQFWLGESLFQRQRYDAAAEQFLQMSTKHAAHPKAAEALLRLAESLAALKQKEMSCATLAEVGRKYPRASASVKQGVEREQKRVHC